MSDEFGQLQQRAYGRPLSEADAREAQAELRLLTEGDRDAPTLAPAIAPAVASVPRRHLLLLGVAATVAAILATGVALAPRPSLDVFASPQSGVPTLPGASSGDDIRWLGALGRWNVFGFITSGGNVCVTAFDGLDSGGGSCTSRAGFTRTGLALATGTLTVSWGPLGNARLDNARR